jgi:DNA-binding NtrC family response regulator
MDNLRKILVADDEVGVRNLLFEFLSSEGFKVTLARDGQESLERMKSARFDLLITDMDMPRLNGIELLKRMKRAGRMERVIIMSARPVDQMQLGLDLPDVFSRLRKPFRLKYFLEVVVSALGKSATEAGKAASRESRAYGCSIN